MKYRISLNLLLCTFVSLLLSASGHAARVELFSPQGTAKEVRQVTARFSAPIVAFGDPRLEDPFTIQCPEAGRGRWIDSRTWVYDFERDLPGGVACSFILKPLLKTLKGEVLSGPGHFSFDSGGPSIQTSRPEEGQGPIDENQVFILSLDAEADEKSVLERVYLTVQGIQERVGIRLIKGVERENLFKALEIKGDKTPYVVFQARQTFPTGSEVKLIWGKGVKTVSGVVLKEDQVLTFKTRKPFSAEFRGRKEKPSGGVIPLLPMKLIFSAPVTKETALRARLRSQSGKTWKPKAGGEGDRPYLDWIVFEGPFPEKTIFSLDLPRDLRDDSGRTLSNRNRFPLKIKTDRYPSLAKFAAPFGIIERNEGGLLPLTVRNLEAEIKAWLTQGGERTTGSGRQTKDQGQVRVAEPGKGEKIKAQPLKGQIKALPSEEEEKIISWLKALRRARRETSLFKGREAAQKLSIPKEDPAREMEVIGIPLKEAGFYVVELESEILGSRLLNKPQPMYVSTAALVTNMAAHFKWGRASSLVWVTSLDQGEPVQEAEITVRDCRGKKQWTGKTDDKGRAIINTSLPFGDSLARCPEKGEAEDYSPILGGLDGGLFIFARKGQDLTFTHSSWNEGIESWRFNVPYLDQPGKEGLVAHTVFDRTLFRAGEEVHMKHFIRRQSMKGLETAAETKLFNEVVIEHERTNQKYTLPLKWRPGGTAESVFNIPEQAKLGSYVVHLAGKADRAKEGGETRLESGTFRVEEFRVPLMRAFVQGPKVPQVRVKEIPVDLSVRYLSGGGAALLPLKLRTEIQPKYITFPEYEEYIFANGKIKTGKIRYEEEEEGSSDEEGETGVRSRAGTSKLPTQDLILDGQGGARTTLSPIPESDSPKDLLTEVEFRDPNGETQTVTSRIPIYPAEVLVGISSGLSDAMQSSLKYSLQVLDLKGLPLPQIEVKVKVLERKTYSFRRRISGGFYAFEHITEIIDRGEHCQGKSDSGGQLFCQGPSPVSGSVILQAQALDGKNHFSFSNHELWVLGKDDVWDEAPNDDRIDLIPEKRHFEAGEQARFQVRMPFRKATVLVTVEREGVLDTYIKKISRENPMLDIPVKEHYAPNVFVSALIVRGRLSGTRATAFFDPGKPAYKMGLTEIKVGWKAHELKVEVSAAKDTYQPRERVRARIKVRTASGRPMPRGGEAVIAVVDEGLLELKANESWKLLEAMMRRRGLSVETATAQMMVVGKRHFGRKALRQGGGGGRQLTRELFDTLVHWKGTVALDEKGEAAVEFNLNDSLTSFRIVAVAQAGENMFGSGGTSIRTHQDVMILSGLPALVREEDRFRAGFTVRNASAKEMKVEVRLQVKPSEALKSPVLFTENIPAGESREVGWRISAPAGTERLIYEASVQEKDGPARDRLKVFQKTAVAVPIRPLQATLVRVEDGFTLPLARPGDAVPGRGGVQVLLRSKLSESLSGVTAYMKDYPYSCLEQKISRAVVLGDRDLWRSLMDHLPIYLDDEGLAKYFPLMNRGSDVLTAYLLSIGHEAGLEIPGPLKEKMIKGLKGIVEGRVNRFSAFPVADLSLRKLAALEALSRFGAADKNLLASITIEPQSWPTSALLDWSNLLMRVKHLPDRMGKIKEAQQILRNRMHRQGTLMDLSTDKANHLWWLMTTGDSNSAKALLTSLEWEDWKEDHPRLLTGVLGRMKKGRWDTTTANALGFLAIKKFGGRYESTAVSGRTEAVLQEKKEGVDWEITPAGREVLFPWPGDKSSLSLIHKGGGAPWAMVRSQTATPLKQPLFNGYHLKKTVLPVEQKNKNHWSKGDVIRVRLDLESQGDMTWVAVTDPIPAGSQILGGGLGRDSALLTQGEREQGWAWETYRERSFEALRVYYEYVPKGKWSLEYTLRLNNEGTFYIPQTRVEALYAPEMFGELPNARMVINP
ncbi:MAG: MG2 domain-containing protein [Thermodesulfobacteriota bacterium]